MSNDDRIQDMVEAQHEDPEADESILHMQIAVPKLDGEGVPLTDEQIRFALANHAMCVQQLAQTINGQEQAITTLLYIVFALMKQYPLDLDDDTSTEVGPAQEYTGQYL